MPVAHQDGAGAALRITVLGRFQLVVADVVVPESAWRLRKARSLLKILALAPGQGVQREIALDLLWPELDGAAAANNLRGVLLVARRAIGPVGRLVERDRMLVLEAAGGVWIDAIAFEQAAIQALGRDDLAAYGRALDLYAGDLLPEDHYEDWTMAPRERYRTLALQLLGEVAQHYEAAHDWAGAIAAVQRALQLEPVDEDTQATLMRLYARAGQRSRALAQWETLQATLHRELDLAPSAATQQLYQAIVAGEYGPIAPPALAATVRTNLPIPLGALIGRRRAVTTIKAFLARERLVTLVGSGGCGKTRLALAVGRDLLPQFRDGVWLLELATLTEPALLLRTLAQLFAVAEQPRTALIKTVCARLGGQELLLVIDNAEHLRAACAETVLALLAGCPGLRVLVTSRVPLGIPEELVWRVPSLAVPLPVEGSPAAVLATIAASPAVTLLVERVRAQQPAFTLNLGNMQAVAAVVRRLDGIPLALELAAARVAVLPVKELAERLAQRVDLLADPTRPGNTRQQTMRATLDWSYALLTPAEQRLFALCGVFVGGFTLAALEAVGGPLLEATLLDDLGALVAQSLVQVTDTGSERRYALLQVTREYAAGLLAGWSAVEQDDVQAAHAAYYLALTADAEAGLVGRTAATWTALLSAELANLRAALRYYALTAQASNGLQLCYHLWRYWNAQLLRAEGRQWFAQFLPLAAVPPAGKGAEWYVGALFGAAFIAYEDGDLPESQRLSQEILHYLGADALDEFTAGAYTLLSHCAVTQGDLPTSKAMILRALAIRRQLEDPRYIAITLHTLGRIASLDRAWAEAERYLLEAIRFAQASGDQVLQVDNLRLLATIYDEQGNFAQARTVIDEALVLARANPGVQGLAMVRAMSATIAIHQGVFLRARDDLLASFALMAEHPAVLVLRFQLYVMIMLADAWAAWAAVLQLAGALASLEAAYQLQHPPRIQAHIAALCATARLNLDRLAAERAWGTGLGLDQQGALAAAHAFLSSLPADDSPAAIP